MTTPKASPRKRTRRAARPAQPRRVAVSESQARQVWLAGLGALAATSETANGLFEELVARGRKQEPATRAAAERVVREARGVVESVAAEAGRRSKQLMNGAVARLGIQEQPRSRNILHRLGDVAEALL